MDQYYTYQHTDGDVVVYVGHGSKERAWAIGNRGDDHRDWCNRQIEEGLICSDWTTVLYVGLTKSEAEQQELALIDKLQPEFNRQVSRDRCVMTDEQVEEAVTLREEGLSYKVIGDKLDLSTMTVYRLLKGITKGYKL
jgi:DNA-directed RNA polymerase specialized sigma24 family protein